MRFPLPLLLVILAALVASAALAAVTRSRRASAADARPLRILSLGDSYSAGEGVDSSQAFPAQFASRLRAAGHTVDTPVVLARTGWTTEDLLAAMATKPPRGPYDLVTLDIGVNDQYRGLHVADYAARFAVILAQALDLAGSDPRRVVVLSIPDWGVTPFGKARDIGTVAAGIDRFNAVAHDRVRRVGVHWVDVTGLSRAHGDDPRFLAPDGLHPSGAALIEWARAAVDSLGGTLPGRR